MFLFALLVSSPSLPAYPFTSVSLLYVLVFALLVSSSRLSTYPFTSVTSVHVGCSRNRMT